MFKNVLSLIASDFSFCSHYRAFLHLLSDL